MDQDISLTPRLVGRGLAALRGYRLLFREIDLALGAGEGLVLRGSNGSGKSTLLRIFAGLRRPSAGEIDLSPDTGEAVHYLGHCDALKPFHTPRRVLDAARAEAGLPGDEGLVAASLAAMDITDLAELPIRVLSAGQKRRTALGRLLVVPRKIWLLDEPFASLDVSGRDIVERLIRDHLHAGGIVVTAIHGDTALSDLAVLTLGAPT